MSTGIRPTDDHYLMTISECAEFCRLSVSSIHRLVKQNGIPSVLICRRRLFRVGEIKAWIKGLPLDSDPARAVTHLRPERRRLSA